LCKIKKREIPTDEDFCADMPLENSDQGTHHNIGLKLLMWPIIGFSLPPNVNEATNEMK
jgi:hypothetical protein